MPSIRISRSKKASAQNRTPGRKSTRVQYEVSVKTEGVHGKGFLQKLGVLVIRLYVRCGKLSLLDVIMQEAMAHTDVRQRRVGHRALIIPEGAEQRTS